MSRRKLIDYETRYRPATLLLMARNGGRLTLDSSEWPYEAFQMILEPVWRPEDDEIVPSTRHTRPETRVHIGLRHSILQMRADKHPEDGRVSRVGFGDYLLTEQGEASIESFLYTVDCPLEWLDFEVEDLDGGGQLHHYRHPLNGDDIITFFCESKAA
jgi:hypothetical protein